ncbi:MAG: hypothetical protein QW057_09990 [Candidatus Bathyarchaeia archaeon]
MTVRERIVAALHRRPVDMVPFMHWDRHFPRGQIEREVRSRGMGLCIMLPFCTASTPNVEIVQSTERDGERSWAKYTYYTPVGSVSELFKPGVGSGQGLSGRDFKGLSPWRVSPEQGGRLIKRPEDYDIVRFMVEDTRYTPYYDALRDFQRYLGEDGIVVAALPHSPFQMMLIDWVGPVQLYKDYARHREKVEKLYGALVENYRLMYPLAADAPVEYVGYGDNIDGVLVTPPFFERYYAPNYDELADMVHVRGKVIGCHMDGRLKILAPLIAKTKLDVIEAFTPPPMGDLAVDEALSLWKEKVLWINFPASVYVAGGPAATRTHLISLLRSVMPGDRVILAASTENYVPLEVLTAITAVMEKAAYPLTKEALDAVERST